MEKIFKVNVIKVNTINSKRKVKFIRGKKAFKSGYKEVAICIIEVLAEKKVADDPEIANWINSLLEGIINNLKNEGLLQVKRTIAIVNIYIALNRLDRADYMLKLCKRISVEEGLQKNKHQYMTNLTWNLACSYLAQGDIKKGWKYYDAGLLVPAPGKQKYQRSLFKPFSREAVALWRGEELANKTILVLGEQGIGDTMMFSLVLLEFIKQYKCEVIFVCGDRLLPLYKRSLIQHGIKVISHKESTEISPNKLDYMVAIGSILQHIAPSMDMPYLKIPLLIFLN